MVTKYKEWSLTVDIDIITMDQILTRQPVGFLCGHRGLCWGGCLSNTSIRSLYSPPVHTHTENEENGPYRPDVSFRVMIPLHVSARRFHVD